VEGQTRNATESGGAALHSSIMRHGRQRRQLSLMRATDNCHNRRKMGSRKISLRHWSCDDAPLRMPLHLFASHPVVLWNPTCTAARCWIRGLQAQATLATSVQPCATATCPSQPAVPDFSVSWHCLSRQLRICELERSGCSREGRAGTMPLRCAARTTEHREREDREGSGKNGPPPSVRRLAGTHGCNCGRLAWAPAAKEGPRMPSIICVSIQCAVSLRLFLPLSLSCRPLCSIRL
jgi:hypothetical protein